MKRFNLRVLGVRTISIACNRNSIEIVALLLVTRANPRTRRLLSTSTDPSPSLPPSHPARP